MKRSVTLSAITLVVWLLSCTGAFASYSIVVNKGTNILTLYDDGEAVKTFPVATGRSRDLTPEGVFTIVLKLVNPIYGKLHIPGGSPRNPLGPRWMGLSYGGGGEYGIHGNNDPSSIGRYVSSGCIRLRNNDVIWLFDRIPLGTRVKIVNISGRQTNPHPIVNYTVFVDGNALSRKPFISGANCLVPVRPAIEAMGCRGTWVENDNRYDIKLNGCTVSVWADSNRVTVDNHPVFLPVRSIISAGGYLCVHPDFFSAVLGGGVHLDGKGKIEITSPLQLLAQSGFVIPAQGP